MFSFKAALLFSFQGALCCALAHQAITHFCASATVILSLRLCEVKQFFSLFKIFLIYAGKFDPDFPDGEFLRITGHKTIRSGSHAPYSI